MTPDLDQLELDEPEHRPEPPPVSTSAITLAARSGVAAEVDYYRELWGIASQIASTDFVPVALRGKPAQVLAAMITGRELGMGPMTSLRHVYIIDGRVDLSSAAQLALIRRAGHSVAGQATESFAEVIGTRADTGDTMTVRWTLDMAVIAGLVDSIKDGRPVARSKSGRPTPWERYPASMLWARAVTTLADQLFSECIMGGAPGSLVGDLEID